MNGLKSFKRIKRQIERTFNGVHTKEQLVDYIKEEFKKRDEKIENQAKALEIGHRSCLPLNKRFSEILVVASSNSKITINPCDGRITVKVSEKCSSQVKSEIIKLSEKIFDYDKFEPMTFRGKVNFDKKRKVYCIYMQSESKRFHHYFEYTPGE